MCDDTDVFVLLVHYYNSRCTCSNSAPMVMSSSVKERAVIDIRATVESHSDIADALLAIHGLSGADTVASFNGICKATVVKVAKKGCFPLFCICDVHAEIKSVEAQTTEFTCAAYGKVLAESCNSMTEYRVKMWRSETGKSGASSVKLCSIPPTTETFTENVHICHLQVAIWKAALLELPPEMDATRYGWELDHLHLYMFWFREQCLLVHCRPPADIIQLIHCIYMPLTSCVLHIAR